MEETKTNKAERTLKTTEKKWFGIWSYPDIQYIGAMEAADPTEVHDPRIGGDGKIVVQELAEESNTSETIGCDDATGLTVILNNPLANNDLIAALNSPAAKLEAYKALCPMRRKGNRKIGHRRGHEHVRAALASAHLRLFQSRRRKQDLEVKQSKNREEEQMKTETAEQEQITLINGNGNAYTLGLPKLFILGMINDTALEHIAENTGLRFEKKTGGLEAQPDSSQQIVALLLTYNFKTKYYNNLDTRNTIFLKNDHHVGFQVDSICFDCVKHNHIVTNGLKAGDRLAA